MKRYKLIREYPGSPKLGTIFEYWTDGISEQIYNKSTTPSFIPLKIVKDYPEFWEEIDNNFILPEIWWVRITKENLEDVYKFLGFGPYEKRVGYVAGMCKHYLTGKIIKSWNDKPTTIYGSTFGNEITTEQFKKYVLKETEEKIVEKDYEILSFISTENNIAQLSYFTCENNFTGNDIWNIYSIKRKDGEIFTIGDKVIGYNNSIAKIKTIDLVGEVSLNIGTDKHEGFSLKNLKKAKQPIFQTEDGVDIFEGDKIFVVSKGNLITGYINENVDPLSPLAKNEDCKLFSTKEAAEEYILMNKPVLSLSDVWDHLSIKNRKLIIPFVKNKLNQ